MTEFGYHYGEWQEKRIQAITEYYGTEFFSGKTLLELGCGHGDIGIAFAKLGADVTFVDAREEHLVKCRENYPSAKTLCIDLDNGWPPGNYDIIVHLGTLYHLKDYKDSLEKCATSCQYLVLETEVLDSTDNTWIAVEEDERHDQAFNRIGNRPTTKAVEDLLTSLNFEFERIKDDRCNSGFHNYDWEEQNTMKWRHGLRRFWFCKNMN